MALKKLRIQPVRYIGQQTPLDNLFLAKSCSLGPILGRDLGPNYVPDMGEQSLENEKGFFLLKDIGEIATNKDVPKHIHPSIKIMIWGTKTVTFMR